MFNLVFVTPFDDESLGRIFSTACGKFFAGMSRDVAAQVRARLSGQRTRAGEKRTGTENRSAHVFRTSKTRSRNGVANTNSLYKSIFTLVRYM